MPWNLLGNGGTNPATEVQVQITLIMTPGNNRTTDFEPGKHTKTVDCEQLLFY